jgi:hypothetical protein
MSSGKKLNDGAQEMGGRGQGGLNMEVFVRQIGKKRDEFVISPLP